MFWNAGVLAASETGGVVRNRKSVIGWTKIWMIDRLIEGWCRRVDGVLTPGSRFMAPDTPRRWCAREQEMLFS